MYSGIFDASVFKIVIFFAIIIGILIFFWIRAFISTRTQISDMEDSDENEIPDVEKDTGFDFGLNTAPSQKKCTIPNISKQRGDEPRITAGALFHEDDFQHQKLGLDEAYICEVYGDGKPKTAVYRRRSTGKIARARVVKVEGREITLSFTGPKSPTFTRKLVNITNL